MAAPAPTSLPQGLQIRPPTALDRRAWRMLLPEVARDPEPCRVLVAILPLDEHPATTTTTTTTPRVVGAIASTIHQSQLPVRGPRVALHVIAPCRRRGIGRAMLEVLSDLQRREGSAALYSWSLAEGDAAAAAVWRALGFTEEVAMRVHELPVAAVVTRLGPIFDQAVAARFVPPDARIVRLRQATPAQLDQILSLHLAHLGGAEATLRAALTDPAGAGQYDVELSLVLLHADKVAGFSLGRMVPGENVCSVDAIVLDPAYRQSWANLWLRLYGARMLLDRGVERTRFQTFDHHTDTRAFARHHSATSTRRALALCRRV